LFVPGIEIFVAEPEIAFPQESGGHLTIRVPLRQGEAADTITFRIAPADPIAPPLLWDALLPLLLVPAMKLGSALRFGGPISRQLLSGAERFQEIFSTWYPEFQKIVVHAEPVDRLPPDPDPRGIGVFFSGGLDSSYSLLKHQGELTHAIFVHGCDIPLSDIAYRDTTVARLTETAQSCGVRLISVETDLLRFSDRFCHWGNHYHGSALAAIALILSASLRQVYIASSTSFLRIIPWGSSAVTDPLWSTPLMRVVYDGAEKERLGKAQVIATAPVALRNLRVCFDTPTNGYNCGQCEKCYRTMVALRVCGALDHCAAFDRPLDLVAMRTHPKVIATFGTLRSWIINREEAHRAGTDPELIRALDDIHQQHSFAALVTLFALHKNDIVATPHWRAALPKFRTALFNSLRDQDPDWFAGKVTQWLPSIRDHAFQRLADHDRPWFKKSVLRHRITRLLQKIRRRPKNE